MHNGANSGLTWLRLLLRQNLGFQLNRAKPDLQVPAYDGAIDPPLRSLVIFCVNWIIRVCMAGQSENIDRVSTEKRMRSKSLSAYERSLVS